MESDRLLLQWQDIKYFVTDPKDKSKMKEIVKGISGEIVTGEMIAILGPSGNQTSHSFRNKC
jgi:ABC-type lipoprotein export system ATPase subunit